MNRSQVKKLADLARLELTDEELDRFAAQLGAILGYVKQLEEVDVTGVEPTSQVTGLQNVLRDDTVDDSLSLTPEQIEAIAPEVRDGYLVVPAVFGEEATGGDR